MAGRGDNNKSSSSGRGAGNQSNQPFDKAYKKDASLPEKQESSLDSTENQNRLKAADSHRSIPVKRNNSRLLRTYSRTLDLLVDDVPYMVKAEPFSFNDELRFYITVNDGPEHVFTWDSELGGLRAIDDGASILPDALEEAISQQLQARR